MSEMDENADNLHNMGGQTLKVVKTLKFVLTEDRWSEISKTAEVNRTQIMTLWPGKRRYGYVL